MNYDEAIKIMQGTEKIDENNILEKLMECFDNGKVIAFKKGEYEIVLSALETAKKEHELLRLYKEFRDIVNKNFGMMAYMFSDDAIVKFNDIINKITELERELK